MTARLDSPVDQALTTVRRSRTVLVAIHIPMVAFLIAIAATGLGLTPPGRPGIAVPAGLALGALQLRHSLAFARRERPRHAFWSYAAVVALSAAPILEIGPNWWTSLWFVGATGAMVVRGRLTAVALLTPALVFTALSIEQALDARLGLNAHIWNVLYALTVSVMGSGCLYGAAHLVRVVDELFDARAASAEMAIGRERLRVSRDLHDILGQSLSAVSLKGDLALRLLRPDPERAEREVRDLTELARETLRDVRAVALDERAVSLRSETTGAVALLEAAGIDVEVNVDVYQLPTTTDVILGWAVREGVTNVLRHSAASRCAIRASSLDGQVRLQIVNDGVVGEDGEGHGLAGLAERARALHGSSTVQRSEDGWFRLHITVPEEPG